jgi:hypothetical protein
MDTSRPQRRPDDVEEAAREADTANGDPGALDTDPGGGALPSDADVQAERQPMDERGED